MKVLLSDGSGLTSRQVATQLDRLGHEVSAAVSDDLCMARFTRHVRHLVAVPNFGPDPLGWCDRLLDQAGAAGIDVIFPTQEQVTVLSHQLPRLRAAGLATAVPPFAALRRVYDKVSACATLDEHRVLQPRTSVLREATEASAWGAFPAFVKTPVGTGSTGVRRVVDRDGLVAAVEHFMALGAAADGGVLVQEALDGTLVMAQCVFSEGELMAFHVNERVREGANGSASSKCSVSLPSLQSDLARLGRSLDWHGALSVDAIVTPTGAQVIDVNPRLVEPANAQASGTDLVGALLAVALGRAVAPTAASRPGVRTHQLLMAVLGAAQRRGRRRDMFREVSQGLLHRGVYAGSAEELQPLAGDWKAGILPVAAVLATSVRPALSSVFTEGAVSSYALSPEGWRTLCATAPALSPTTG
jgi:biotin carboxylase